MGQVTTGAEAHKFYAYHSSDVFTVIRAESQANPARQ